jgi:hypothetical protein
MFGSAGLDVRGDPVTLLPILYAALVGSDDEDLSEAVERSFAWALGLDAESPLVPITEVLLIAPSRGMDVNTVLGHLFGIPAFGEQVRDEDRAWHSSPGITLIGPLTAKIGCLGLPASPADRRSDGMNDQGQGHTTPLSVHVTPSWRHRQKGCPTGSV